MRTAMILSLTLSCWASMLAAQEQAPATLADPLESHEQAFVDLLTNAVMVGQFSIGAKPDQNPKAERYTIQSVRKVSGDDWIVQARITYGKIDVPVPVPVQVKWAGDTPMIQVTDLSIPLVGDAFTARVLFQGHQYAGTWAHGKVGGHMWGRIEPVSPTDKQSPSTSDNQTPPEP